MFYTAAAVVLFVACLWFWSACWTLVSFNKSLSQQ